MWFSFSHCPGSSERNTHFNQITFEQRVYFCYNKCFSSLRSGGQYFRSASHWFITDNSLLSEVSPRFEEEWGEGFWFLFGFPDNAGGEGVKRGLVQSTFLCETRFCHNCSLNVLMEMLEKTTTCTAAAASKLKQCNFFCGSLQGGRLFAFFLPLLSGA